MVFLSIDEMGFTSAYYIYTNKLNCDDKCLIILLKCKVSSKQYAEETTVVFRLMWNNCKDNGWKFQRNENCVEQHFYDHFYSEGHNGFLGNVSVSVIDKTVIYSLIKGKII